MRHKVAQTVTTPITIMLEALPTDTLTELSDEAIRLSALYNGIVYFIYQDLVAIVVDTKSTIKSILDDILRVTWDKDFVKQEALMSYHQTFDSLPSPPRDISTPLSDI